MDEGTTGVTAQADVQTSTTTSPVENKQVDNAQVSTEKSLNAESEVNSAKGNTEDKSEHMVPKSRMDEYRVKLQSLEKEMEAYKAKAEIADRLSSAFMPQQEVDPIKAEADATLREMGYVRKEDVEGLIRQAIDQRDFERNFGEKIDSLAKKYNGEDGTPKFDPENVIQFMVEKKLEDPEIAYELMNREALLDARLKKRAQPAYTERSGAPVKEVTDTNRASLDEVKKGAVSMADHLLRKFAK